MTLMLYKPAIKMVPEPLWGRNVRSEVPQSRWSKVRRELIDEQGLICQSCGKTETESKKLQAHEVWEYETNRSPAVAHLKCLALSCWHCHALEHFGRTLNLVRSGQLTAQALDDTIDHFCRINKVGRTQFETHVAEATAEWTQLNQLEWVVDWGDFEELVMSYQAKR